MANVFIHGRSPTNQQLSLRCDATGVLLSTVDIAGENGEKLIINQLPLPEPPTIAGSINALNFGLDTVNNEYHPVSIDENGLLNVNVISGGGAGSGIIKGADIDGGDGIDISADTKIQSTIPINRLYTHSSLYAEYTDGFNQKSDLPLNCDENGLLNVNVVGGDSFDGVIKGISKTTPFPAVSISADASNIEGIITNKLYTRSSIFGVNYEVGTEAQVGISGDGEMSVNVKNLNPISTEISNNVIVSPIVQKQSFDVVLNDDLYGDSTGDLVPPFQRNNRGHQGWYYVNSNPTNSSNVYYYSNLPAFPITLQSDVLLENINFFYAVITIDFVGTLNSNLPFLVMGSQALGNETDITPNFMNTRYAYTLPAGITYIAGEPIVIYWSDSENKKPLETFMPNLRRIKCNNPIITGTGESTKLGFFSVNTSTEVQQKQEYTLIGAGYKFNNAQGEQGGVLNDATFDVLFTANTLIESNLAKLTFTETNELLVNTGGAVVISGSYGNIANNTTILTGETTGIFDLSIGNYKKDCILTVNDSSITSTGFYIIIVSSDGGTNYEPLGIIQPITYITGNRGNSTTLNLTPYNRIGLINGSGDTYNNVIISLYSS
jgi:hypothetical protein